MNIKSFVDYIAHTIQQSLSDEGIRVISAYPSARKPTVLTCPVITVGLGGVELNDESIDDCTKSGELCVFADIFLPNTDKADRAVDIFSKICASLDSPILLGVSAGGVEYDKAAAAYVMKTSYKFNQAITFGGEDSAE